MLRTLAPVLLVACLLGGCGTSTAPTASPTQTVGASPAAKTAATTAAATTPSVAPTPTDTAAASTANIPAPGSAKEIGTAILMAPALHRGLYVLIPSSHGSVLTLLDGTGKPRPGWPQVVEHSTACTFLTAAADGSARVICDGTDLPVFENDASDVRAFAFSEDGRVMPGWPVAFRPAITALVSGDVLTVLNSQGLTDTPSAERPVIDAWTTTVAADGALRAGTRVPRFESGCGESWTMGPSEVAYGVTTVGGWCSESTMGTESSTVTAIGSEGTPNGWPVTVKGSASPGAYGPDGQIVLTIGSTNQATSRVAVVDPATHSVTATSAKLPMATAEGGVDCVAGEPEAPLVSNDGTIFVTSEIDPRIFALDQALKVLPGWPYMLFYQRVSPGIDESDLQCQFPERPSVGPNGTIYVALVATSEKRGGRLVAVGRDGRMVDGWPVTLQKPGSAFWSVVVGADGTAYALAIEPESGGRSSATILAIAPDSTVRYRTTVVDQ